MFFRSCGYIMEDVQTDKVKRKTYTSSAVKKRYNDKTYIRYGLALRKDEDVDVIEMIEAEKAKGYQTSEAIKNLIRQAKK